MLDGQWLFHILWQPTAVAVAVAALGPVNRSWMSCIPRIPVAASDPSKEITIGRSGLAMAVGHGAAGVPVWES